MVCFDSVLTALICGTLFAQPPQATTDQEPLIKTNVDVVSALTWVYDANGHVINGLRADQFKVFDNNRPQTVDSIDVFFHPISMVICIQSNSAASALLPALSKWAT